MKAPIRHQYSANRVSEYLQSYHVVWVHYLSLTIASSNFSVANCPVLRNPKLLRTSYILSGVYFWVRKCVKTAAILFRSPRVFAPPSVRLSRAKFKVLLKYLHHWVNKQWRQGQGQGQWKQFRILIWHIIEPLIPPRILRPQNSLWNNWGVAGSNFSYQRLGENFWNVRYSYNPPSLLCEALVCTHTSTH